MEVSASMKDDLAIKKLITSIFSTILLLYFIINTTSPKIIFIPFLICSISMAGKSIAQIFKLKTIARAFQKLFILGLLLFLIGFLVVACYISIRDKNYNLLIFSIPFWIVGIYLLKCKLLNKKATEQKEGGLNFGILISIILVSLALLIGIFLIILGVKRSDIGLCFAGVFFTFGAFTFVLAGMTVMGYFDKFKVDVLGLYIGILFVVIGVGITAFILKKQLLGVWILIPILMALAGVVQTLKCLRNKQKNI